MSVPRSFIVPAFIRNGQLKIQNRKELELWAATQKDCELTALFERRVARRSMKQNSLYWVGYVHPLADKWGWTPDAMHAFLKMKFIPPEKRKVLKFAINDLITGEIIEEFELDQSTTTILDTEEWTVYLNDIERWAATHRVAVGSNRHEAA